MFLCRMQVIITIIVVTLHHTAANNIICNTTHECKLETHTCDPSEDCFISCSGNYVCEGSHFYCADDFDCTINADGSQSMKTARIHGATNSNLFLTSVGIYAHFSGTINCPTNADCVIHSPTGESALFYATVDATNSNLLNITNAQTWQNLARATIRCPTRFTTDPICNIKVSGPTTVMFADTKIYATQIEDLSLKCVYTSDSSECDHATLHCANGAYSCPLSLVTGYDGFECTDTSATCAIYYLAACDTGGLCGMNYDALESGIAEVDTCSAGNNNVVCSDYNMIFCDATVNPCGSTYDYHCAVGRPCYIQCIGDFACEYATFNCPDSYRCTVYANGNKVLKDATINGGTDGDLYILSIGSSVHFSGNINCPTNANCVIRTPSGRSHLFYAVVDARNSNLLNITNRQTNENLVLATIYCPAQNSMGTQPNCNIKVSNNPNNMLGSTQLHVTKISDLSFECTYASVATECNGATLHCAFDYLSTCPLTLSSGYDEWECSDGSTRCKNYYLTDCDAGSICGMNYVDLESTLFTDIMPCASSNNIVCADYNVIICDSTNSCASATYDCEAGKPCYIQCNGDYVCQEAIFNCPDNGYQCTVRAQGVQTLYLATIHGGVDSDLYVYSAGSYTGRATRIYCPTNADCIITSLSGDSNLFDAWVYAQTSNVVNITSSQTWQNLAFAHVYCPTLITVDTRLPNCNIKVSGATQWMLRAAEIYVGQKASLSLECTYATDSTECDGATLYCAGMFYSCPLGLVSGYDEFECSGTETQCNTYHVTACDSAAVCAMNHDDLTSAVVAIATCSDGNNNIECTDYHMMVCDDIVNPCGSTYHCAIGKPCYIQCIGEFACEYAKFTCPDSYRCTVYASGKQVLKDATINGGTDGDLYILSAGAAVHFSGNINCPTNADCVIHTPSGGSNLFYAVVDAKTSNLLNITNAQTYENLHRATIYCPAGHCNIKVSNDPSSPNNMLLLTELYLKDTTELSFECTYGSATTECDGATLHCADSYLTTCDLDLASGYDEWECNGYAVSVCDTTYADLVSNVLSIAPCTLRNNIACANYDIIICDRSKSCAGTTHTCQSGKPCYIQCNGDSVCNGATFNCPNNGHRCTVRGQGNYALELARINGGMDSDLYILSSGSYTVTAASIYCPTNGDCVIDALSGDSNLFQTKFYAQYSNLLNITSAQTDKNLASATVYCPSPHEWGTQHNCNIKVSAEGTSGAMLADTKIYAIESFTDISLQCNYVTASSECATPVIYCGLAYEYSCDMVLTSGYSEWGCIDPAEKCHDYIFPTSDPTSDPTRDPTKDPTAAPSFSPTRAPSGAPSETPSGAPSAPPTSAPSSSPTSPPSAAPSATPIADPTVDPTADPTVDPTADPTSKPTQNPTQDPTNDPSRDPTTDPTVDPTRDPTRDPTGDPTDDPTVDPTDDPTADPTVDPTEYPTHDPTAVPTVPTHQPTPFDNDECVFAEWKLVFSFSIVPDGNIYKEEIVQVVITVVTEAIKLVMGTSWDDGWCIDLTQDNLVILKDDDRRRLSSDDEKKVKYVATMQINDKMETEVFQDASFNFNLFKKILKERMASAFQSKHLIPNTDAFAMESVGFVEENKDEMVAGATQPFFDLTDPIMITLLVLVAFAVSFIVLGKVQAGYTKADDFKLGPVFLFTIYVWDFFTDLLFAISLYNGYVASGSGYLLLFVASVLFLIGPLAKNFYDLLQFQEQWQNHPVLSDVYSFWLQEHGQIVYMLSFLSGSTYAAINLVNSNFIGHRLFSMGLSRTDLLKFNQKRLVNVVILENLPQLIIQIIFAYGSKQLTDIALLAIASSSVSICVAVLKHINHKKLMEDAKMREVLFLLKIFCSNDLDAATLRQYRHKTWSVSRAIARIFGFPHQTVECLPMLRIADKTHGDGLHLHCIVRTSKKTPFALRAELQDACVMETDGMNANTSFLGRQIAKLWRMEPHVRLITTDFESRVFEDSSVMEIEIQRSQQPQTETETETTNTKPLQSVKSASITAPAEPEGGSENTTASASLPTMAMHEAVMSSSICSPSAQAQAAAAAPAAGAGGKGFGFKADGGDENAEGVRDIETVDLDVAEDIPEPESKAEQEPETKPTPETEPSTEAVETPAMEEMEEEKKEKQEAEKVAPKGSKKTGAKGKADGKKKKGKGRKKSASKKKSASDAKQPKTGKKKKKGSGAKKQANSGKKKGSGAKKKKAFVE